MDLLPKNNSYPNIYTLLRLRGENLFRPFPNKCDGAFEVIPGNVITANLADLVVVLTAFFNEKAHISRQGKSICRHIGEKDNRFYVDTNQLCNFVIQTPGWVRIRDEREQVLQTLR